MARAKLTFADVKASKAPAPAASAAESPQAPEPQGKKPGRPAKRDPDTKTFGMTLRVSGEMRKALRKAAEDDTDARGLVVSVHDVIMGAVEAELARRGIPTG